MTVYGNGNVGIGTDIPDVKLAIEHNTSGNIVASSFTNRDFTAGNRTAIQVRQFQTAGLNYSAYLGAKQDGNIFLSNDSITADHFVMDTSGNVGIGSSAPVGISSGAPGLTLNGTNATVGAGVVFQVNGTTKHYQYVENDVFRHQSQTGVSQTFWTDGSEKMTINNAGVVKLNSYSSTSNTGTPTYLLGTDASGNIVKTLSGPGDLPGQYTSRSIHYDALTGDQDDWFPLFTVSDMMGPVNCKVFIVFSFKICYLIV
jgi:hypothetical protein